MLKLLGRTEETADFVISEHILSHPLATPIGFCDIMATSQSLSGVCAFMASDHLLPGPAFFTVHSEDSARPSSSSEMAWDL